MPLPLNLLRRLKPSLPQRICRWLLLAVLAGGVCVLLGGWAVPAAAQLPAVTPSQTSLPVGVERLGLIEVTGVDLEGREIIKIASPAVLNRAEPGSQVPVEVRARQIEGNLKQLFRPNPFAGEQSQTHVTLLDPASLEVVIKTINDQPVLLVTDDYLAEPRVLLTVTDADAQYHFVSKEELAERWQQDLEQALRQSLQLRQPQAFQRLVSIAAGLIAGLILLSLLMIGLLQLLHGRKQKLHHQIGELTVPTPTGQSSATENRAEQLAAGLQQRQMVQFRIQLIAFFRWLLIWGIAFLWFAAIATTLYIFPQTREFANRFASAPVLLLLSWFLMGLVNQLANFGINRAAHVWEKADFGYTDDIQRRGLRITTTISTLKGIKTVLIYSIGIIWVLQILKITPVSVLAFGAVLALAVSFAIQNLIQDLVYGFLILLQDRYAIGDYIAVGTTAGLVENMDLLITQIRTNDGNLVTLPNGAITQVENMSRNWARANLTFAVAYDTDVDQVLTLVRKEAQAFANDPAWSALILDPTEILGVDQVSHAGIVIRLWIRTLPLQQWSIAREFRRRLHIAFAQHGIEIGIPQQMFASKHDSPDPEPDAFYSQNPKFGPLYPGAEAERDER